MKTFTASMAITAVIALFLATPALCAEKDIRKALEGKVGKVEQLQKAPIPGWWEVIADGQVVYVDDKANFILLGNLIDLKSDKNLTAERQSGIAKELVFSQLSLAMKQVRGNGKNVIVTFEDPNCGYCKKLAQDIQKLKNVTVYTYLFPVLGDDSMAKSKAIWCSADRSKAWFDWMQSGKAATGAAENCDTAGLDASLELGRKLRINGTPAIFFSSGERSPGYMPAEEIEKHFGKL